MRDLMFAAAMLMAIPLALMRPLNAYLMWGWTAVLLPTSYFYGFMGNARLNLLFALISLAMVALGRVKWPHDCFNRVSILYLIFLVHATLSFLFAYPDNPYNAQYYEILLKVMVFCLVMPLFIRERWHFHAMFLVIALGLGMHGVVNGLKVLASLGAHNVRGPDGSMISDRNHLATALAMVLPVLYYLYLHSTRMLIRWGFLIGFGIVALAILGSGSRAGFIAISVVSVWMLFTVRRKWVVLLVGLVMTIAFINYAPERWTQRLSTIQVAGEDESFRGRVIAWEVSSAIAMANPILGGGFHAVQAPAVWERFKTVPGILSFLQLPTYMATPRAAHSIYFEVWADLGLVGLGLFLLILAQSAQARFQIRRATDRLGPTYLWARDMSDALLVALVAYMIAGASVSLAYFEVLYMIVMLMELIRQYVMRMSVPESNTRAERDR